MNLKELAHLFNRAFEHIFDARKFLTIFLVLLFSGVLFLFFLGFALCASHWMKLPLLSIPFIVMSFLLMVAGAACEKGLSFFSREHFKKAFYFFLPLLAASLVFWILLGFFVLIKSIPYLGTFLGIILAFAPFLLNLCLLLLLLLAFLILFFFTPLLAYDKNLDKKTLLSRFRADLFTHVLSVLVALFPLWVVVKFLAKATLLTFTGYTLGDDPMIMVLQGLFILIPISALLALPLIFFFNFAMEVYPKSSADESVNERGNASHRS